MSEQHTPSTKGIQETYVLHESDCALGHTGPSGHDTTEEEALADFRRWYDKEIAAAERRGAISALRDAAQQVFTMYGGGSATGVFLDETADRLEQQEADPDQEVLEEFFSEPMSISFDPNRTASQARPQSAP
ncbi:hypothetical protein [Nesterenkonia rhizosphaerae]|uniref:Uncharacterized protein n=1 Tax=Nesterenkonia rhizosphaerae TaxID=1348272 RepID=A0ABP9G0P5_9MICC